MMETINAKQTDFKHRLFISSGFYLGLIMFVILELLLLSKPGDNVSLQIILFALLVVYFTICFNKSKYYLDRIDLRANSVLLDISKFDEKIEPIEISYENLLLKLKRSFVERYPKYILEFRSDKPLSGTNKVVIYKQYQLGYWNKKNLKKAYQQIRELQ